MKHEIFSAWHCVDFSTSSKMEVDIRISIIMNSSNISNWFENNLEGRYWIGYHTIYFEFEEDSTLFKLTFF